MLDRCLWAQFALATQGLGFCPCAGGLLSLLAAATLMWLELAGLHLACTCGAMPPGPPITLQCFSQLLVITAPSRSALLVKGRVGDTVLGDKGL